MSLASIVLWHVPRAWGPLRPTLATKLRLVRQDVATATDTDLQLHPGESCATKGCLGWIGIRVFITKDSLENTNPSTPKSFMNLLLTKNVCSSDLFQSESFKVNHLFCAEGEKNVVAPLPWKSCWRGDKCSCPIWFRVPPRPAKNCFGPHIRDIPLVVSTPWHPPG